MITATAIPTTTPVPIPFLCLSFIVKVFKGEVFSDLSLAGLKVDRNTDRTFANFIEAGTMTGGAPTLKFVAEPIFVVGEKLFMVPLIFRLDLYKSLGWTDRVDGIAKAIARTTEH